MDLLSVTEGGRAWRCWKPKSGFGLEVSVGKPPLQRASVGAQNQEGATVGRSLCVAVGRLPCRSLNIVCLGWWMTRFQPAPAVKRCTGSHVRTVLGPSCCDSPRIRVPAHTLSSAFGAAFPPWGRKGYFTFLFSFPWRDQGTESPWP